MTGIAWEPHCWPDPRRAEPGRLRAFEAAHAIAFPPDFTDCILQHQGMSPDPCAFSFGAGYSSVLNNLLHFEDAPAADAILVRQESLGMSDAPAGLIAFAVDPAGNLICFDYRTDLPEPPVVFLDHGLNAAEPVFVATGFAAFLALLR